MTDDVRFNEPTVVNKIKYNKTGSANDNGKKIADYIKDTVKDLARDVDVPGKAAFDEFTLVVGTPTVGYWIAIIEVRIVWPNRTVVGVPKSEQKLLTTFQATFKRGNENRADKGPFIIDQMLVEPDTGKPIDKGHSKAGKAIAERFSKWFEEQWPPPERQMTYRKPSDRDAIEIKMDSITYNTFLNDITNAMTDLLPLVTNANDERIGTLMFISGSEDFGWFKIFVDIDTYIEEDMLKIAEISCVIWFKNKIIQDLGTIGIVGVEKTTNQFNRKDVQKVSSTIADKVNNNIKRIQKEEADKRRIKAMRGYLIRSYYG